MVDQKDPRIINSVQRTIDILGLFTHQRNALTITEISQLLHLSKSTAAGLVYTLVKNGYMDQDPETRKYRLGLRLAERGEVVHDSIEIEKVALPHLYRFQEIYDESIFVAVIRGFGIVVIKRLWGSSVLRVYTPLGDRIELVHTATGTALLAAMASEKAEKLLNEYYKCYPEKYDQDQHSQLLEEIEQCRCRGYSVNLKGRSPGVIYVGAAIRDFKNEPVAVIVVSVPSARLSLQQIPKFGEVVCATASAISADLGYKA